MSAKVVGLALQLVGTVITGAALAFEWRSSSRLTASTMAVANVKRENPYWAKLDLREGHRITDSDIRRYHERVSSPFASIGMHPEVQRAIEVVAKRLNQRDVLAAEDWEKQKQLDDLTRKDLVELFNQQAARLVADQQRIRVRVRWEMFGLLLVAIGTTISSLD